MYGMYGGENEDCYGLKWKVSEKYNRKTRRHCYEKYLNQYNIIMLNIQDFLSMTESVGEMLSFLQMRVIKELKKQYPDVISEDERLLTIALEDVYSDVIETIDREIGLLKNFE